MSKRARAWVAGIAACVGALHAAGALARWSTFHNETFDLAFYARMAWGLARGDLFDPIVGAHVLGLHVSPVLLPLGLLGGLLGTVPVLLVAQAAAVALAAFPIARIGARRFGDMGAVLGAVAWLAYPNLGHVAAFEMHPGTLAVLPLAWMADAIDAKNGRTLVLAAIGVLLCREDLALVVAMAAVLAAIAMPGSRKLAIGVAVVSIVWVGLFVLVVHPRFGPPAGSFDLHFGKWGRDAMSAVLHVVRFPGELVEHLSLPRRLLYLPLVLAPLGLLPLARLRWLLPAAPVLAMNLLSDFPTTTRLDSHYLTPVVPFLVVGALDGAALLAARARWIEPRVTLAITLVAAHVLAGGTPLSFDCPWVRFWPDERTSAARDVLARIGSSQSVQAPFELLPHLAERPILHRVPPPDRGADVVVLDISHRRRFVHQGTLLRTSEEPLSRTWLARSDRVAVDARGDYLVLGRSTERFGGLGRRYVIGRAAPTSGVPITHCLAIRAARLRDDVLDLDLVARDTCSNDLAIRIGPTPRPTRVDLLFDGLLSPAKLRAGDRLRSSHALSESERATITRTGSIRIGALRSSGARPNPSDPTEVEILVF